MSNKETKEVGYILEPTSLSEVKHFLENWHPSSKGDAMKMLFFMSSVNSAGSRLKSECYDLINKAGSNKNHYFADLDLTATPVTTNKVVYNDSDEIRELEAQIEDLQKRLAEARERAGVSHTIVNNYWKIKQG